MSHWLRQPNSRGFYGFGSAPLLRMPTFTLDTSSLLTGGSPLIGSGDTAFMNPANYTSTLIDGRGRFPDAPVYVPSAGTGPGTLPAQVPTKSNVPMLLGAAALAVGAFWFFKRR